MESVVYERMAQHEDDHWWFRGRRTILDRLLRRHMGPSRPRILEVGCGTGGNLSWLSVFGDLAALEMNDAARVAAARKSGVAVVKGRLHDDIGLPDASFDLITLLDVLEHIDEDVASLRNLRPKFSDDGRILITVPAHPWLWSAHVEPHHHKRRYTRETLPACTRAAGYEIVDVGYFNTLLFPLVCVVRGLKILLRLRRADDKMPPVVLNWLLYQVFSAERHVIGRLTLPTGASLYLIAKRDGR